MRTALLIYGVLAIPALLFLWSCCAVSGHHTRLEEAAQAAKEKENESC